MKSQKILLFGGSGFLGSRIVKKDKKIISPTHSEIDLTEIETLYTYLDKAEPEKIIYCAGISRMDFAEKNKQLTNKLNFKIPMLLSKFSSKNNIDFIYLSTDAVFDGYKSKFEFTEKDRTKAKSTYGLSKEKGEDAVLSISNNNTVIRVINLFGLRNENNFLQKMKNNLSTGKEFAGITDQINNPLNVDIAAKAILFSAESNQKGIYNLGALNSISNYTFLVKAANELNLDSKLITEIKFSKFIKNKSYRKKESVLVTDKFHKASNKLILKNINDSISYLNLK